MLRRSGTRHLIPALALLIVGKTMRPIAARHGGDPPHGSRPPASIPSNGRATRGVGLWEATQRDAVRWVEQQPERWAAAAHSAYRPLMTGRLS